MWKNPIVHAVLACGLAAIITAVGCAGEDPVDSTVVDFCTRADDCNYLDGHSVQECIDAFGGCVGRLPPSNQEDWVNLMDPCLDLNSCSLFLDCWSEVPWC